MKSEVYAGICKLQTILVDPYLYTLTLTHLKENIGLELQNTQFGIDFLDMTQKA